MGCRSTGGFLEHKKFSAKLVQVLLEPALIVLDFSGLDGQPFDLFVGLGNGNFEPGSFLLSGYGLAENEVHFLRRFLDRRLGYVLLWELRARAQSEDEGKRIRRQARRHAG
jgi:hypothetical protein